MMKFRSKLLLVMVSVFGLATALLGIIFANLYDDSRFRQFEEQMTNQTNTIAGYIEKRGGIEAANWEDWQESLELLFPNMMVLSAGGKVLYEPEQQAPLSEEAVQTVFELVKISEGQGVSRVTRESDDVVAWEAIANPSGATEGYVLLVTEIQDVKKLGSNQWIILIGILILLLSFIIVVVNKIATSFTKPIEDATRAAAELAKGNYRARTYENPVNETKALNTSINALARNLQEMENSRETQQERLSTLIENIGSGVLLIDSKGYIMLMNRTFKQIFRVSPASFLFRLYYEAIPYKDVEQLIEEIFITEKSIKRQMRLSLDIERRHFEVYGAPIISTQDEWKGIVLVFHDITELKKLEKMRQDFVANVSHELRTPITSIKGFSETLLDGGLKDEKTLREFLTIILNESDRLQVLITELLELSKIEKSEFALNYTLVDLNNLLTETERMFRRKAEKRSIELAVVLPEMPMLVEGDAYRLKQIFINLMSNALNYTPPHGSVQVTVRDDKRYVCVEVSDTGIGIDQQEIPRIFERFYRIDRARSRNSGGTGLGLAIVKHLVEAHDGQLEVHSKLGKGTSFIVKLKKRQN
ncbi:MAG: two-component system histidine kinase PnpS [Bacillus sp. (in: firmicutes)]